MLLFGYDYYDKKNFILRPNGTRYRKNLNGKIFNLYLPPWWGEILNKTNIPWGVDSVKNIIKKDYDFKWFYLLEPLGDSRGWLGKYADGTPNVISSLTSGISPEALSAIQDNRAILCLYQAGEASPVNHVNINLFEEFYKELKSKKVNPSNFIFVTGNMIAKNQYKEWKENSEYKDEEDFHIIEFSGYRHINYKEKWTLASEDVNKKIKKHFLCYNRNMQHPHRTLLLSLLNKEEIMDSGLVSYPNLSTSGSTVRNFPSPSFNLGNGAKKELLKSMRDIAKKSPSIIDVDEWRTNHFDTSPSWPYEQTLFSLVSESHFVEKTLFLSEKIWKVIANNHPFVLVGSYHTLKYLREEGFKTFNPYIDESYDNEIHPYKRIVKIVKEVKRLCSLNKEQRHKFLSDVSGIVQYNYQNLMRDQSNVDRVFSKMEKLTFNE